MDRLVIPESPGFKALKREIEVVGEARALFTVLGARKLRVDDTTRERIERCADPEVLDRWIERAVTATVVSEIFDPGDDAE